MKTDCASAGLHLTVPPMYQSLFTKLWLTCNGLKFLFSVCEGHKSNNNSKKMTKLFKGHNFCKGNTKL